MLPELGQSITMLHDLQLTHPLLAALVFHALLVLSRSPLLAAAVPISFYWGREMRDAELALGMAAQDGWQIVLPWAWPWAAQRDFWPAFLVTALLFVIWEAAARHRARRRRSSASTVSKSVSASRSGSK